MPVVILNAGTIDPWINLDGRLNAPAGTPQYPTLLNNYVPSGIGAGRYYWPNLNALNNSTGNLQQPPWRVAGVDYPVGIDRSIYPTDASLKDPTVPANLPSGVTYFASASSNIPASTLLVEANNVTLDGFDLSVNNGVGIMVGNPNTPTFFNNLVVTNCKFVSRGSQQTMVFVQGNNTGTQWSTNCTIKYCTMDGGGAQGFGSQSTNAPIFFKGSGNFIVEYCWLTNFSHHGIDMQPNNTTVIAQVKYNVISDYGYNGGHPNTWYFESNASGLQYTFQNSNFDFNTIYESPSGGSAGGDSALAIFSTETTYIFLTNVTGNNSVVISLSTPNSGIGPVFSGNSTFSGGVYSSKNCSISNNYYDPTTATVVWAVNGSFPYGPTFTGNGNVNMTNGANAPAHPT